MQLKMARKIRHLQERHYSAHHMLIRAASVALDRAKDKKPGWLYDELSAITFSALAIEALCNSIGERVVDGWADDFESSSPNAKLRILAERLGLIYDKKSEPWAGAYKLIKFRNRIAHAKPQLVVTNELISEADFDKRLLEAPKSKLEKMITASNAEQAVRTVEAIKTALTDKLSPDQGFGLTLDAWTSTSRSTDDV